METLLKALTQKREKRQTKKHIKITEDRDIQAVKQYLNDLTIAHQTLPMCGNKLNKVEIAQASGIDRNAIYRNAEIQKLLDAHINRDVTLHDIKTGSQLEILGEYLRSLTDRDKGPPLILNGKPNKRRIAQEASIRRNVFYENAKDANKLLEEYLCV